jgi:hypothetical protein
MKVWAKVKGSIRFYSERFGGRPFVQCLPCATMTVLRWMGYDIIDGDQDIIRAAIPGNPQGGLTFGQVNAALRRLFPNPPTLTALDDATFLAGLKVVGARGKQKAVYAVVVRTGKLPPYYQRLVGQHYDGLHGMAVVAKTTDSVQVYELDPMGRTATTPPYVGELINWTDLSPALVRDKAGKIRCFVGTKNTAEAAP